MNRLRTTAVVSSAVLGLAIAVPSIALADPSSPGNSATPQATVTQNGQDFTVTVPGVGGATFVVDPTTGVISNAMASASPGFVAGAPVISGEQIIVRFMSAAGGSEVLKNEVHMNDGVTTVRPEVDEQNEAPEAASNENEAGEHSDGDHGATNPGGITPTTEVSDQGATAGEQGDESGQGSEDVTPTTQMPPPASDDAGQTQPSDAAQPGSDEPPTQAGGPPAQAGDDGNETAPSTPPVVLSSPGPSTVSSEDGNNGPSDGASQVSDSATGPDGGQQSGGHDGGTSGSDSNGGGGSDG